MHLSGKHHQCVLETHECAEIKMLCHLHYSSGNLGLERSNALIRSTQSLTH